jgi:hypothetical protein
MSFEQELEKNKDKKEASAYDLYNKYVDLNRNTTEKVSNWFSKYWEQIISLVIAFFLIGIQQFAEPQFDPLFFLKPTFWYEFVPYVMSIWIIIISTLTSNMRWSETTDVTYIKMRDSIQTHVNTDKETPYIFKGARIVDTERKKIAWRAKISEQIDKKRKKNKIPTISSLKNFLDGDDKVFDEKIKMPKKGKITRLRAQFTELFSYLEDDYIDKYIDTIKIKYNQVNETVLVSGLVPSGRETSQSDFRENTSKVIFGEFGAGFIVSSLFSAVILALDLVQKGADVTTWIVFIFKAFMLYTYYFRASARSPIIFQRTRLKAIQERDSMLNYIKRLILNNQKGE